MGEERIRVFEVTPGWGLGGTEQAVEGRAALLPPSFFDVYAIGVHSGPRAERLARRGVHTVTLGGDFGALERLVYDLRPHVVHYSRLMRDCAFTRTVQEICKRGSVPVVVETNVFGRPAGWPQTRPPVRIGHMSLSSMWRYARQADTTMARLYEAGHRAVYLPVPTPAGFGEETTELRDNLRQRLGVRPGDLLACRVTRPDLRKWSPRLELALPAMLKAVPTLKIAFMAPPAFIAARLKARFGDRIVCLATSSDLTQVTNLYAASDFMLHSSAIGESFGLCMAEGMYHGLPVVVDSTPTMDNAQVEVVEHERCGFVVASPSGFVAAVERLSHSPDLRRSMSEAARQRARERFTDVCVVRQWERLYVDACLASGVPVPEGLRKRSGATPAVPDDSGYAEFAEEYERRCAHFLGKGEDPRERLLTGLLRARYTAGYARALGFRTVWHVLQSRLRSTGSLQRN
jgi:hypothetical protein